MKGLDIPVGVNSSGSAATLTGDEQDKKIISLALGSDENENAFQQDIGLGNLAIFKSNDQRTRTEVIRRIKVIFEFFESQHRFKLIEDSITWEEGSSNGEMVLEFYYLNIESDELTPFQRTYAK